MNNEEKSSGLKIHKIFLEIELKDEFQKAYVEDVHNLIKNDVQKFAFSWNISSAYIK